MGRANNPCKLTHSDKPYMKKPCICEVCTCGRHQCPHQVKQRVTWGPCVMSEYSANYRPHCFDLRKAFVPETGFPCFDEPLSDQTTHRTDYKPQPLCLPWRHEKEGYKPTLAPLDSTTNYRLDYTPKKACPTEPCLPLPVCSCPGNFDGSPTYRSDYRPWNLPPLERCRGKPYKPPDAPFEGLPTYRTDYVPKCEARRSNFKPKSELAVPDSPLNTVTNYRSDYVPHPLQPRSPKEKELPFKSQVPFNGLTTFQSDYTPKKFCLQQPFKPLESLPSSTDPMSQSTTHRVDYTPHALCPPYRHPREEYKKPEEPMEKGTTYQNDYPVLPLCKPEPMMLLECPKCPGPFDGTTVYCTEFKHWNVRKRVVKPAHPYCPPDVPMETLSTNKADFGPKLACKVELLKPAAEPLRSGPFDGQTNYRIEYTPKSVECHCPAAYLSRNKVSPDGYTFEAVDPCGHEHYKLMENQIKA
ncbi:Stabilizer of axonemal microtubules 1 [Echinococcus granulosus]|uniref:Protein FAM154A n=1 Tax=Echinococcus granulosus TaxID=6210 RepID=U6IVH7_ECHGR|nr:hypothetical protein EGR_07915 [Echinococcus granulosus]EUB57238.1 hypothetical protein EGR_07915 [Echinococcus granulosus]KAH9286843.1 Stabilizer of axonemal microtubules 1 [Echinococcus granulosus]CDS15771.1 protein FAM154A [Echinococcus granulosus]